MLRQFRRRLRTYSPHPLPSDSRPDCHVFDKRLPYSSGSSTLPCHGRSYSISTRVSQSSSTALDQPAPAGRPQRIRRPLPPMDRPVTPRRAQRSPVAVGDGLALGQLSLSAPAPSAPDRWAPVPPGSRRPHSGLAVQLTCDVEPVTLLCPRGPHSRCAPPSHPSRWGAMR